ncbi:MAG: hypothetical protein F4035_06950 [Acidimicrobiia bacterium]|nr:hypothetical protein [Acidimicrobiia bacterium]
MFSGLDRSPRHPGAHLGDPGGLHRDVHRGAPGQRGIRTGHPTAVGEGGDRPVGIVCLDHLGRWGARRDQSLPGSPGRRVHHHARLHPWDLFEHHRQAFSHLPGAYHPHPDPATFSLQVLQAAVQHQEKPC